MCFLSVGYKSITTKPLVVVRDRTAQVAATVLVLVLLVMEPARPVPKCFSILYTNVVWGGLDYHRVRPVAGPVRGERNVATKTSLLVKLLVGLCLCLGAAGGLLAQPQLTVTITGTLGPWISGSGWITSAKYVLSPGFTATGAKGTFCVISINGANTTEAAAEVRLSAINTPSVGTLTMLGYGNPAPTAATAISSYTNPTTNKTTTPTAACSGTANVTTVVDDSVGLNGGQFTGITTIDPVGISYTGSTSSYPASFNASIPAFSSGLTCPNTTFTTPP